MKARFLFCIFLFVSISSLCSGLNFNYLFISVIDDTGTFLPCVEIQLESSNNRIFEYTTNDRGFLVIPNLRNGRYRLVALRQSFWTYKTDWFELTGDDYKKIQMVLLPDSEYVDFRANEATSLWAIKSKPFPSMKLMVSAEEITNQTFNTKDALTRLQIISFDKSGTIRISGDRSQDIRMYWDGVSMIHPLTFMPFMYPPLNLFDNCSIRLAGFDGYCESVGGAIIDVSSAALSRKPFSGDIHFSSEYYSDSNQYRSDFEEAITYWNSNTGKSYEPVWKDNQISNQNVDFTFSGFYREGFIQVSGEKDRSDRYIRSDYLGNNIWDNTNIWGLVGREFSNQWKFSGIFGFDDEWISSNEANHLRGYTDFLNHNDYRWGLITLEYITRGGILCRLHLNRSEITSESGPQIGNKRIKSWDQVDLPAADSTDLKDVPFILNAKGSMNQIQMDTFRTSKDHFVELGSSIRSFAADWKNTYFLESTGETETLTAVGQDYQISLWGRDRWFPGENLEIAFSFRWDRYHYLIQADHISPRFQSAYHLGSYRIFGGFDRVISPPSFLYISQMQIRSDRNLSDEIIESPETGFRWFAGVEHRYFSSLNIKLEGFYSLMNLPIQVEYQDLGNGIGKYYPYQGNDDVKFGINLDSEFKVFDGWNINFRYFFRDTKTDSPLLLPDSLITVDTIQRFPQNRDFNNSESSNVLIDDLVPHAFFLNQRFNFHRLWDFRFSVNYQYNFGKKYSQLWMEDSEIKTSGINKGHGPAWQRLDLFIEKIISLGPNVEVSGTLGAINVLGTIQDPLINPFSGNIYMEPYSSNSDSSRQLFFKFGLHL